MACPFERYWGSSPTLQEGHTRPVGVREAEKPLRHAVPSIRAEPLGEGDQIRSGRPEAVAPAQATGQVGRVVGIGEEQVIEFGRVPLGDPRRA